MASNELYHQQYASPYYDPEYQHRYYEEHKKLVGRKSTSGLNSTGKAIAKSIKEQINDDKKAALSKAKEDYQSDLTSLKSQYSVDVENAKANLSKDIAAHTAKMNTEISRLQDELEGISDKDPDKSANVLRIKREIAKLREENDIKKASLTADFGVTKERMTGNYEADKEQLSSNFSSQSVSIGEEYTERYLKELDSLKSVSAYTQPEKKATKTAAKSTAKKTSAKKTSAKKATTKSSTAKKKEYTYEELKRIGKMVSKKLEK